MQVEGVCCKVGVQEGSLCMCAKSELECIVPTTCVKMTEQFFCLDCRCAFPCDDEVPCAIACLGLTICRDYVSREPTPHLWRESTNIRSDFTQPKSHSLTRFDPPHPF